MFKTVQKWEKLIASWTLQFVQIKTTHKSLQVAKQ